MPISREPLVTPTGEAALYTVGLPRDIRDARRAEIEDDLWSQAHDGLLDATGSGESGDVLARLVFGMSARGSSCCRSARRR